MFVLCRTGPGMRCLRRMQFAARGVLSVLDESWARFPRESFAVAYSTVDFRHALRMMCVDRVTVYRTICVMVLSVHYLAYCVCKLIQQLAAVLRNKSSTWLCRHWQDLMLCGNAAGNVHVKLVPFATLRFQLTFMTVACRRHHWRWGVQRNFQKLSRRTEIGGRWASFFGVCHFVKNLCSFRLWNFARNGVASVVCGSDGNKTKEQNTRPRSRSRLVKQN